MVLSGEKIPATGASALPVSVTLLSVPSTPAVVEGLYTGNSDFFRQPV